MDKRHNIFLSYSRKDSEMMRRVRDTFISAGLTVWTDEGIEPGTESWKISIEQAIEQCGALLVLLSPDAKKSIWVRREIDHADTHGKRIFSLLVRGDAQTAIPFGINGSQFVDIRNEFSPCEDELIPAIKIYIDNQNDYYQELEYLKRKLIMAYVAHANFKNENGYQQTALIAIEEALKLEPGNTDLYVRKGEIYIEQEKQDLAIASFRKAIRCDYLNKKAHYALAQALEHSGNIPAAIDTYTEISETFWDSYAHEYAKHLESRINNDGSDNDST